jgi:membrane protein required for colicin V production
VNWLDIVLAIIVGGSIVAGFMRGFARVGIGLAATIVGLILGIWFYGTAGAFLLPYVSHRGFAYLAGFILVFFGVLLAGSLVGWMLAKLLRWAGLGWLDRLGGAAAGLLRGLLMAIGLVMALVAFSPKPPPAVVESRLAPYVIDAAHVLVAVAPRELRDGFHAGYERVKKIWSDAVQKGIRELPQQEL